MSVEPTSLVGYKQRKKEEEEASRPHCSGRARCLSCKYEWMAVVFAATYGEAQLDLECPQCHLQKGVFKGHHIPNLPIFVCNCGNDLFYFTNEGDTLCPLCGAYSDHSRHI